MSKKLIVGNWKMNPSSGKEARLLVKEIKREVAKVRGVDIVVCPPFTYLRDVKEILGQNKILIGAQDMSWAPEGSYTGEISGAMLKGLGVKYVVVGHSERRKDGESDEMVNKKVKAALRMGIIPIVCVGERERDSHGYYIAAVKSQVEAAFVGVPSTMLKNCVIAYEPIWAVGNADFDAAMPHDAVEATIFIKKTLADTHGAKRAHDVRVLYGGSVNTKNADEFLREKEVAGLLIGRESLVAKKFSAIAALS